MIKPAPLLQTIEEEEEEDLVCEALLEGGFCFRDGEQTTETEACLARLRASRSFGPTMTALKALAGDAPEDVINTELSKLREGQLKSTLSAVRKLSAMAKDPRMRQMLASRRCRCEALLVRAARKHAEVPEVVFTAAELVLELVHNDTRRSIAGDSLCQSCQCVLDAHEEDLARASRKHSRIDSGSSSPRSVMPTSTWTPVLQADPIEARTLVLEDAVLQVDPLVPTAHTTTVLMGRLLAALFARRHSVAPCLTPMQVEAM